MSLLGAMGGIVRRRDEDDAPWTPADYPGATHWWRGDLGVTHASGEVSAWLDQISGDSLSQATPSRRPNTETRDSQTALYFDAGDALQGAFGGGALAAPTTALVVVETAVGATQLIFDGDDVTNRNALYRTAANWFYFGSSGIDSGVAAVLAPRLIAVTFDGAGSDFYITDMATPAHSGNPGAAVLDGLTVGASYVPGTFLNGWIWEVLLAESDDAGGRAAFAAYAADRYAGLP